jgi:phosphoglycolate phosphatase
MSLKSRVLIFDFDGTIVDTKGIYYKSLNKHLTALGFSKKQVDDAVDLGLNLGETIKKLIPSKIKSWFLKKIIMKDVVRDVNKVKKCRNIDVLREIKVKKILISNSYFDFLNPIIKHLKLKKYFSEIYSADDFDDKAKFIKKYLRKNNLKKEQCLYIGDRVADVEVAREIGMKSVIISNKCSWNSRQELLKAKPDFIISEMKGIKTIL